MISYIHAVTLLSAQRVLGHSLDSRTLPHQSFGDRDRDLRGNEGGDLVDSLSEGRVILDKVKVLELRMRYQIEKLIRLAEEPEATPKILEGDIKSSATSITQPISRSPLLPS
jgi:U3 small nucleolar ribonucleoprotein protein LCP5